MYEITLEISFGQIKMLVIEISNKIIKTNQNWIMNKK